MRPCSSAPTRLRRPGVPCNRFWTAGPRGRVALPTMRQEARDRTRRIDCLHATGMLGCPSALVHAGGSPMLRPSKISLLLADVDGTLVTHDKVLTDHAQRAVRRLQETGIRFAITSGRPPKGMAMLIEPLRIEMPIAGFNGGLFVRPDLSIIEQ